MSVSVLTGDAREVLATLPAESVHCVITSPPYWGLRAYKGDAGMIGLEPTFDEHIANLVAVFREVRRALRPDGTLWLNYGDAYAGGGRGGDRGNSPKQGTNKGSVLGAFKPDGFKPKDLMMMPARVALALQADGWWLRSEIVWHKPNPMPESVTDRPTSAHEKLFLLTRESRYFYDAEAVRVPNTAQGAARLRNVLNSTGRRGNETPDSGIGEWADKNSGEASGANLRNVWTIPTHGYSEAHFATFPPALVEPCIKAGCPADGTVLDPFGGAGTVGLVADRLQRNAILIEISPEYADMARQRIADDAPLLAGAPSSPTTQQPDKQAGHGRRHAGFNERWKASAA